MRAFDYVLTRTVEQTVVLLARQGDQARILSGGTDLLVQLREGRLSAALVVDIKDVPEANVLNYDPALGLQLGAAVPCHLICGHQALAAAYPGLLDAVSLIGGIQIQGRASVGGNLCNASPAADTIPALIVHRAVCVIAGPDGCREVPVEEFCTAPGQTVLNNGEFLVSLHIPPPQPGFGASYLRFIPRNEMDIAVVGAGASLTLAEDLRTITSARVALGAVAPTPLFIPEAGESLTGREATPQNIEAAARIAQSAARPISDMRGTAGQRRHLSFVLARRALSIAFERAQGMTGNGNR